MHKPSGRAVVALNGRDWTCGTYGTPNAVSTYNVLIGRWLAEDRRPLERTTAPKSEPVRLTVRDLVLAYQRHADSYYRDGDGELWACTKAFH